MNKNFFIQIIIVVLFSAQIVFPRLPYDFSILNTKTKIVPIVGIGAGPAGLMAASYAARSKLETVIITGDTLGGQLTGAGEVENMPGLKVSLGADIVKNLEDQARDFGAHFIEDSVESVDFSSWPFEIKLTGGDTITALAVIIATGAAPRKLGIPGELEYWGSGVSACAICDCFMFKNRNVAIVGGGDAAIEQALHLAPYAKNITIFVRKDYMRAAGRMQDKIESYDFINVVYNKEVLRVFGDGQVVTGLELLDTITQETSNVPIDGLFLAIGHNPNTGIFAPYLKLSEHGYIVLDTRSQETSTEGIFAAGDVADYRFRQAGIATGSGIQAALEAIDFLREINFNNKVNDSIKSLLYSSINRDR